MLLRHTATYLVARGVPGLISFAALALYTRLVSPEQYGEYALVIAGVGLTNVVLLQWLRMGMLRFLVTYRDREDIFLSTILALFLFLVVLSALCGGAVLLFVTESSLRTLVLLGIGLLWVQAWFDLNLEMVRSQLSPSRYGLLALSRAALGLALGGTFAYLGLGAVGLLLGLFLGMLIPASVRTILAWRKIRPSLADRAIIRQLLAYGLPLTATFLLVYVIHSSDRFMLGWLLGTDATGLYAVGYDLADQGLVMLMMVVNLAAYPLAIQALEKHGTKAATQQLSQNFTALIAIALPAAAGLALLAPNIAGVFLGREFQDVAASLIPWVALAAFLAGMKAYYFDLAFQLGRRTIVQMWIVLIAAVMNVLLNLLLIPRLGIMAAAYSSVAAYAAGLGLSWWLGKGVFPMPFPPKVDFARVLLAALGMSVVVWALRDFSGGRALMLQLACGVAVYGGLLVSLNIFGLRKRVLQAVGRLRG